MVTAKSFIGDGNVVPADGILSVGEMEFSG